MSFGDEMSRNRYKEVEVLRDPEGVSAVITERTNTGHLSFRIQKEYEDHGEIKVTSFLSRRHIPAIRRILEQIEDRLDIHVERQKLSRIRTE